MLFARLDFDHDQMLQPIGCRIGSERVDECRPSTRPPDVKAVRGLIHLLLLRKLGRVAEIDETSQACTAALFASMYKHPKWLGELLPGGLRPTNILRRYPRSKRVEGTPSRVWLADEIHPDSIDIFVGDSCITEADPLCAILARLIEGDSDCDVLEWNALGHVFPRASGETFGFFAHHFREIDGVLKGRFNVRTDQIFQRLRVGLPFDSPILFADPGGGRKRPHEMRNEAIGRELSEEWGMSAFRIVPDTWSDPIRRDDFPIRGCRDFASACLVDVFAEPVPTSEQSRTVFLSLDELASGTAFRFPGKEGFAGRHGELFSQKVRQWYEASRNDALTVGGFGALSC